MRHHVPGVAEMDERAITGEEMIAPARRHGGTGDALDAAHRNGAGARIDAVGDVEGGGEGRLLRDSAVAGRVLGADLDRAERRIGGEDAGRDDLAVGVDERIAVGRHIAAAHRLDAPVAQENRARLELALGSHGDDGAADDGDPRGRGR